jgi:hypothetical protein
MKPDKIYLSLILLITITIFSWISSCTHVADISNFPEVCFERDVLPIFASNCAISGCHSGGGGGDSHMAFDNYNDIISTVVPYNPDASQSYQAIIAKWGNGMPPSQPLTQESRTIIRLWIEQGALQTICTTGTGGSGNTDSTTTGGVYLARACFTRDILPVIVSRCATTGCHDAITHKEGYNLTSYANIRNAVTPGNPGSSRLYRSITTSGGESKMPPTGKPQLSIAEIDSIGKWITYGALNENCGEICDTINPVTFSGIIWPVIQSTCTGCHSGTAPSGNVPLTSYNDVAVVASNGSLMNSLNGTGVPKMPSGGSLSACKIKQFDIWVNNGFPNN